MFSTDRAPRVLVVSVQKAGTHLVARLMERLEYVVKGLANVGDYASRPPALLFPAAPEVASTEAFTVLSWIERLGGDIASRFSAAWQRSLEHAAEPVRRSLARFSELPANTCLITHDFNLRAADGGFLRDWNRTGSPPVVLNYRDPRDVLVSFVHYLTGRTTKQKHGGFSEYYVYEKILGNLPDDSARLMHAIVDENFPGHAEFRESLWLLRHPNVCSVSFEDLVGEAGGGSTQRCESAVERVMHHLGVSGDPREVAQTLYSKDAFTFSSGRIGKWREHFGPHHLRAFNRRFADVLEQYGYEVVS